MGNQVNFGGHNLICIITKEVFVPLLMFLQPKKHNAVYNNLLHIQQLYDGFYNRIYIYISPYWAILMVVA